ncbi:MAG: pitrilysin family protein [Cyanobacteria bacterium P01_H01_bin.15]
MNLIIERTVSGPQKTVLPCGVTLITEQMPVDAVSLDVWLPVGSAVEPEHHNGMAHFLEHMIFKGSHQLVAGEFEQRIEQRGGVTNAATSQDYTHYFITTAPQDFAELAPLQLDVVCNAAFPAEAFERERMVVLEEIRRSADNPRRRAYQLAMELGFDCLPYRRPVLGPESVITSLPVTDMRAFHKRWYQPQNLTVAAVGNLPNEQLTEVVADALAGIAAQKNWSQETGSTASGLRPEALYSQPVRTEFTDTQMQQARLTCLWRVPGLQDLCETYAMDVLAAVLGQGRLSRLYRELREDTGLVTQVGVMNLTYAAQGLFYVSCQLPATNVPEVEQRIQQQMQTIYEQPITESELNRIRTQVANRFIFGNERPGQRTNLYGYYQALLGTTDAALSYPEQIRALTPAELQATAQRYLNPQAYGTVVIRPKESTVAA